MWRGQRPRIANWVLKMKKVGGLILLDFKIHGKATVIKTECYWWKNRWTNQLNRAESPVTDPYKYSEQVLDKEVKAIHRGKTVFQQTTVFGTTGYPNKNKEKKILQIDLKSLTKIIQIRSQMQM